METTRAAIYCRISSDKEGKALGVERQRVDCLNLVQRNGWTLVSDGDADTFTDNDIGGAKDFSERKAFGRLIAAAQAGKVDAVVAYTQARIYRDTAKFLDFCGMLKAAQVDKLALVSDADIDPSGSLFIATIIAAKDAEERRRIGELVGRKAEELAVDGSYGGGHRPYGYRVVEKQLVKDEFEAGIVREVAQRVLEGESLRSIVADLNERGIKPTKSDQWRRSSLREMLLRPLITGLRQHRGEIIGEAAWPAIIERTQWEQVKDVLTNPDRSVPRPSRDYPLKGILKCGACGRFMTGAPKAGKRQYGCKSISGGCGHMWVMADPIEEYIFSVALPIADQPHLRDEIAKAEAGTDDDRAKLIHEKAEDERMLSQLDDDYADRVIPRARYLKQSQRLQERIEDTTSKIAAMRGYSVLNRLGGQVQETWDDMTAEEQRMILDALFSEIFIVSKTEGPNNRFNRDRVGMIGRWQTVGNIGQQRPSPSVYAWMPDEQY